MLFITSQKRSQNPDSKCARTLQKYKSLKNGLQQVLRVTRSIYLTDGSPALAFTAEPYPP